MRRVYCPIKATLKSQKVIKNQSRKHIKGISKVEKGMNIPEETSNSRFKRHHQKGLDAAVEQAEGQREAWTNY